MGKMKEKTLLIERIDELLNSYLSNEELQLVMAFRKMSDSILSASFDAPSIEELDDLLQEKIEECADL
jgi:hypothetical protein